MEFDYIIMVWKGTADISLPKHSLYFVVLGNVRLFKLLQGKLFAWAACQVDLSVSTPSKSRLDLELVSCVVAYCATIDIVCCIGARSCSLTILLRWLLRRCLRLLCISFCVNNASLRTRASILWFQYFCSLINLKAHFICTQSIHYIVIELGFQLSCDLFYSLSFFFLAQAFN